jgi:hypothetical protein
LPQDIEKRHNILCCTLKLKDYPVFHSSCGMAELKF